MNDSLIIAIETCRDCSGHAWNTRHVEEKYNQYFMASTFPTPLVSNELQGLLGEVEVLQNSIPVGWSSFPCFKGRVERPADGKVALVPHIGAFEVYHKNTLLYSKLASRLWPSCSTVAKKIASYFQDLKSTGDTGKYSIKYEHPNSKSPSNAGLTA